MKTLTTSKAWILICSIVVTSSATIEDASTHHDTSHHGDSILHKKHQNTIVPFGIQIPENVLSTQDVACISADSNIFEIMNKAQETCNGTDIRCTFYHFVNHGYQNIGTLDIDKELFDDLLMKFDNWLLTAENIEKNDVSLDEKTKEDSSLDTTIINANVSYNNEEKIKNSNNVSETEKLYTNKGVHIDIVDHNTNESDDNKIVNTHHINLDETHHRIHHHKWKNGNHIIKLVPEYNNEHRYFEVFLPKDRETGKPRTIYVEVDRDKNEFVLLDEEIDKKLNGVKPIRIELDELSEIADTAFNNIAKSLNHKQHIYNSDNDDIIMKSDINTNSVINEDTTNLAIDVEESTQNTLNSSVCNPNIYNIYANQQLIPDNTTGNVRKIFNVRKNLVVPNKYINQAQFYVESQIHNTTDEIPNDHLGFLESTNKTNKHQIDFCEETPLDTIEFNENKSTIDLDLDNIDCSLESFETPCKNDTDNSTKNYELSTEDETFDDHFIELEENNDTSINNDFYNTHDSSSSSKLHLNEPILQAEKPVQETNPKSTPYIYIEPKLTSSLTAGISEYTGSQQDANPSENLQESIYLQDHSSVPSTPLSPYTTVPITEKNLASVLETDGHLQSIFPAYATFDLPAGASQNTPLNSDITPPHTSFFNFPLESDFRDQTTGPKLSTIFPSPPVECFVKLNKGSKYSPLNVGFSWLPSYLRIEELRLPCAVNSSPKESVISSPKLKNKQLTDSIRAKPSSSDHTIPDEYKRLCQTAPSLDVQEPSLVTQPYHLEAETPLSPKPVSPLKLDLPKSNTDLDRISTTYQVSETPFSIMPDMLKDAVNSPCTLQQIPPYLQPTKPYQDLGCMKYPPLDNSSKEMMISCSTCKNRCPYTTIPYFLNPYLKPQYLEPLPSVDPLQPASKIPTLDSLPLSSGQSNPCLNGDYSKATKPIPLLPFAPNAPFSPSNLLLLGPGFTPNTLTCQNLWNNIPYLPCTILPDQNIKNYPPIVSNYLTPSAGPQQNEILKPLLSKSVSLSVPDQPCPIKNILEMTPPIYAPFPSVYTPPIQMDLSPSLALERDLQSLSLKYGIPLSKIFSSLETEISDADSKSCSSTFKIPCSNLVHDSSLISKPMLSITNTVLDAENQSGYEEIHLESDFTDVVPLDSYLIGPNLELESSSLQNDNNPKSYTVLSETTVETSSSSSFENEPINNQVIHDSSLIGPHLSTLSTSNFVLSDENRNENEVVKSKSDSSTLIPLDSSLIGPHLETGSPPIVNSINSQGDILISHTEVPITISSQIEPKLNIQNQPTNVLLDSSLIGSRLPSLCTDKPLLGDEIQTINDMIPLETDPTVLTPLDSSVRDTQEHFVNEHQQSEILQYEKTAITLSTATASPELHKPSEYLPTNILEEDQSLLESDSFRLTPLDSSLIGPELKLGKLPIKTYFVEGKTIPRVSKEVIQNTDNKLEGLGNIILPSSLLTILLNKPEQDSNLNIITQETKLKEEVDEPSLNSNLEPSLTDISLNPFKETDFKIVDPIIELPSLIEESNIPLLKKDSITLKQKLKSSDVNHVVGSESLLDSSLIGTTILHKLEQPEIFTSLDPASLHGKKESSATTSVLNSSQLGNSLIGPSLKPEEETLAVSCSFDPKDLLDVSLMGLHLLTVPLSNDTIQMINEELQPESGLANLLPMDSSLAVPHVDFESEFEQSEISRYQNPESSLASVTNSEVYKITEPFDFVEGIPLEPIIEPSGFTFDPQKLLSKLNNAITKSPQLPDLIPSDKLRPSIAKISSDNKNISPSHTELQTLTEYSPITMSSQTHEFSPVEAFVKLPTGFNSNDFSSPKTLTESPPYAQGVPQIPIAPYSPLVQTKPLIDRNWLPQPLNFQNILQTSPSFRPVVKNAPGPLISNELTPKNIQPLLKASLSKIHPQLSISNMYTPGDAIAPSSEWTTTSNIFRLDKSLEKITRKKNSYVLPSNSEFTIFDSEHNPIVVDDNVLPFSQSSLAPNVPVFQKVEIVPPSLVDTVPERNSNYIKTRPLIPIPITNALVPSPIYDPQMRLYNPQNIPYMIQTPNTSTCYLESYSNIPVHSQLSEIIGPAPIIESPKTLPSSSLDAILQLPTAANELKSVPYQLPPEYFTPITPMYSTPLTNALTKPILPIYTSPSSLSFAKPISTPTTSLPLNLPYAAGPVIPVPLPINPYTATALTPKYVSPFMVLKITPISDYPNPPTVTHNRKMPSEIIYKPSQTYSSPYIPIHAIPISMDTTPVSPNIMSKPLPAITSPISPVFYEPLSTPYFSRLPKSLTNLENPAYPDPLAPIYLSTLAPTSTGVLSPSYLGTDMPIYSYSSLPAPINTKKRPSNFFTPAFINQISPVSPSFSSYNTPLSLNPKITTPESKSKLPIITSYSTKNPKLPPFSNLQIQQNIPCQDDEESNLLTSPLIEEIPFYDVLEGSTYTYSNDKDDKFYEETKLKYPLESLSYTLSPEEITEALPNEDFIKQEDVTPSVLVKNCAPEPSLQTRLYQHHRLTPYAPLHGKPLLKPRIAPKISPSPSFTESIAENIFGDTQLVHSSNPLKNPVSLPLSILSSPLLKPLTPFIPAPNFPISSPLLNSPCINTSLRPYSKLAMNEKLQPLSSASCYSTPRQEMLSPPINARELMNIVNQEAFVPASLSIISLKLQPPSSPYLLDNHIKLPSTHYESKPKTHTSQGCLVEPSSIQHYNQYTEPIISHIPSLEMSITSQHTIPLIPAQNLKINPLFSPEYMSYVSPSQTTLQDSLQLNDEPIHYQPFNPQPAALISSTNNMFKRPPITLPYTALPSVYMVEPISTNLNGLQSSYYTAQHPLPSSSLPVSRSSPIVSRSNAPYSRINPHIPKQALKNHTIPSSLVMSSDIDFHIPTNKLLPTHNSPKYSLPSLSLITPLETVPLYTPSSPLNMTANPQNILKPKLSLSSVQYEVPVSSSPYLTQSLKPADFYETQSLPKVDYTNKNHPKLSPIQAQYAAPPLFPSYTSLPIDTAPNRQINKPSAPQYNLLSAPVYSPIDSSPSGRNPFINPHFKPIIEGPPYPVPNNIISTPILTPSTSMLLSKLGRLDISQEPQNLYSSPITSSSPLYSSSLLKPLVKIVPQKSRPYQPQIIPSNSEDVSQSIDSVPNLLPSTTPLLSSWLKPLFATSQNNVPLIPMHFSNTNTAFPADFPKEAVPFVTRLENALSNCLPTDSSNYKYSGLYDSLVTEIPEIMTPINPSSTTPNIFLKPQFNIYFKSPVSTLTNIPLNSNYDSPETPSKLPIRVNVINTAKPVEVSAISSSESSPSSLDPFDTETIEKTEPYKRMPDLKYRFPPLSLITQSQFCPAFTSKYLATPQPSKILPSLKYETSKPKPPLYMPLLIPEEAELIDNTDFISLSQIKSEPLIVDYSPTDSEVSQLRLLDQANIPDSDVLKVLPCTTLLKSEFAPSTYKESSHYNNKIPQPLPIYLSSQEYKDITQGLSPTQASLSSCSILSSANSGPQLVISPLALGQSPQTPFYTSPRSITPDNWLESPTISKSLPFYEKHLEVNQENENIQTLLNKPVNKITPLDVNNYPYEPEYKVPSELDSATSLIKSKQNYTEYIEHLKPNEDNDYDLESDNVSLNECPPSSFEAKPTKNLPKIIPSVSDPNYNKITPIPQRLPTFDHFYVNNHIGKRPEVSSVPTYNTLSLSPTEVESPSRSVSPEIFKDFTDIPTTHFGSVPKLDSTCHRLNEYYPEIADSTKNVPITNSFLQNYLNPCLKYSSQTKSPLNTNEIADTLGTTSTPYTPYNNIDNIKYSGYKTYQIPSFKSPQMPLNLGIPTRMYNPSVVTNFIPFPVVKTSKDQQDPSSFNFYRPTETSELLISQYEMITPVQTILRHNTLQTSPELLNEYNAIEDISQPISVDGTSINEDNELKTSLINYINKSEDVKNNSFRNNAELTIPIGNIAISKKEPYNGNTIETNNPSIGLKVWKSNIKIAEAELKLKFKDLSVNNFMPIVNNLDRYDMEEIRKIVKNYIDDEYGNHIEIHEPYTIDNKYTVIKDFDLNAVDGKFNLLWPTHYV